MCNFGNGTALLVTHNRDEAYRLCREMIVMDGGRCSGPARPERSLQTPAA